MGTISDKFNYTFEAKEEIKQATNALGGDLTDDSELKDYAEALRGVYNNLPKVSNEGTEVTLTPTLKGKLGIIPKGNSEQKTVAGNQLWRPYNYSASIFVTSTNGTIIANGTTTSTAYSILTSTMADYKFTLSAGTYTLSGSTSNIDVELINVNNSATQRSSGGVAKTFTLTDSIECQVRARIMSGVTVNNETVKPMLNLGSTALDWEEYTGSTSSQITPSPNPSYPQNIKNVTGNNNVVVRTPNYFDLSLVTNEGIVTKVEGGFTATKSGTSRFTPQYSINLKKGQTIKFYGNLVQTEALGIQLRNGSTSIRTINALLDTITAGTEIEITGNIDNIRFFFQNSAPDGSTATLTNFMILDSTTTTETFIPYGNQTLPLNLGTKKLMLGDYIDNGNIKHVRIRERINSDNFNINYTSTNNVCYLRKTGNVPFYKTIYGYCTHFKNAERTDVTANQYAENLLNNYEYNVRNGSTQDRIYFKNTSLDTLEKWETFFANNEVYLEYELLEETTEALTEEQIAQVQAIDNMKSYTGTTIITSTYDNNNAQMIINGSALKGN